MGGRGWAQPDSDADGQWLVRTVPGEQAIKSYRCPGCDHEIIPGTGHEVVVPVHAPELRRHWHSPCWHRAVRPTGKPA